MQKHWCNCHSFCMFIRAVCICMSTCMNMRAEMHACVCFGAAWRRAVVMEPESPAAQLFSQCIVNFTAEPSAHAQPELHNLFFFSLPLFAPSARFDFSIGVLPTLVFTRFCFGFVANSFLLAVLFREGSLRTGCSFFPPKAVKRWTQKGTDGLR